MQNQRFEDAPYETPPDETDVNLRAYFDAMDKEKLTQVNAAWSDERLREWDGNFRSDGALMLVCCDRDVGIDEFRQVLFEFLEFRKEARLDVTSLSDSGRE